MLFCRKPVPILDQEQERYRAQLARCADALWVGNALDRNGVGERPFVCGLSFKALEQPISVGFASNDGFECTR